MSVKLAPTVHRDSLPLLQHCVCLWFEKNYRLQDIQLSKSRLRQLSRLEAQVLTLIANRQVVVENTGLEPVTSWLQTRRSPS